MAPLAHAMRLVNRKQTNLPARLQLRQQSHHAWGREPFGRDIQQRQFATKQLLLNVAGVVEAQRRV